MILQHNLLDLLAEYILLGILGTWTGLLIYIYTPIWKQSTTT